MPTIMTKEKIRLTWEFLDETNKERIKRVYYNRPMSAEDRDELPFEAFFGDVVGSVASYAESDDSDDGAWNEFVDEWKIDNPAALYAFVMNAMEANGYVPYPVMDKW